MANEKDTNRVAVFIGSYDIFAISMRCDAMRYLNLLIQVPLRCTTRHNKPKIIFGGTIVNKHNFIHEKMEKKWFVKKSEKRIPKNKGKFIP